MVEYENDDAARVLSEIATKVLADPEARRAFVNDPIGTLRRAGIDPESVPDPVLKTLTGLSFDELGVVARVNESLVDAGLVSQKGEVVRFVF
jgi:hypothetical protein